MRDLADLVVAYPTLFRSNRERWVLRARRRDVGALGGRATRTVVNARLVVERAGVEIGLVDGVAGRTGHRGTRGQGRAVGRADVQTRVIEVCDMHRGAGHI